MLDWSLREIDAVAMRLMILRHAKAEKAEPGMRDRDRPLAPRGRTDARRIGTYLVHHTLIPDLVIVSPAQRTRETWECLREPLADALPAAPPIDFDERLYNASIQTGLDVLREAREARTLLVIGHNPGMHEIARQLIAAGNVEARERLNESFPTAALAVIDFAGNDWRRLHPEGGRLERFVTPRLIKAATE
jgi:phosphohistidine phosphatase